MVMAKQAILEPAQNVPTCVAHYEPHNLVNLERSL
jgi:hypothetical protein